MELAMETGLVVQLVLVSLIFLSIVSWAVIFGKWMGYKKVKKESTRFLNLFWNGKSLDVIYAEAKSMTDSPVSNVFRTGYKEFQKVAKKGEEKNVATETLGTRGMENVERALRKASVAESMKLENKLPWLATISSTAPYIGLFGTVWGIMNAFQGIGQGGPATLQNVAPGISEALIATAVALATAIPASISYNLNVSKLRAFRVEMDNFSAEFSNILRRGYLE
ncbi:protein TolQ [bacterium]|nr:protein TolQ [bacterium]